MVHAGDSSGQTGGRGRRAGTVPSQGQTQEGKQGTGNDSKVCDASLDQTLQTAAKSVKQARESDQESRSDRLGASWVTTGNPSIICTEAQEHRKAGDNPM